jgi:hypothetical protein
MAAIPAVLYFFSIFLMIEADVRRAGAHPVPIHTAPFWVLTKRHGYHSSPSSASRSCSSWGCRRSARCSCQ